MRALNLPKQITLFQWCCGSIPPSSPSLQKCPQSLLNLFAFFRSRELWEIICICCVVLFECILSSDFSYNFCQILGFSSLSYIHNHFNETVEMEMGSVFRSGHSVSQKAMFSTLPTPHPLLTGHRRSVFCFTNHLPSSFFLNLWL